MDVYAPGLLLSVGLQMDSRRAGKVQRVAQARRSTMLPRVPDYVKLIRILSMSLCEGFVPEHVPRVSARSGTSSRLLMLRLASELGRPLSYGKAESL